MAEYKTLEELKPLLSEDGYHYFGHGTGRRGSADVVDAIFEQGLRVKGNCLMQTTIGLSVPTKELVEIYKESGMPEPTLDGLKNDLDHWQHLDSNYIIIMRVPKKYINTMGDYMDMGGQKFRAFYNQVEKEDGNIQYYLDPAFIIGCYDREKGRVLLNKKFEIEYTPERIKKMRQGKLEALLEVREQRKRAMNIQKEFIEDSAPQDGGIEVSDDSWLDDWNYEFPPLDDVKQGPKI